MKREVIIVAGGSGKRMGSEVPKQFILLAGKPILMHTMLRFWEFDNRIKQIVALPSDQIEHWQTLCKEYNFEVPHQIVKGGKERFFSVKNAVDIIDTNALVAIHDGVRPFVSDKTIHHCFLAAEMYGVAIPTLPIKESLRIIDGTKSMAVNRSNYCNVQTPQVFKGGLLREGYEQQYNISFTDDASVVEQLGYSPYLIEGNIENIKITTPLDLKLATIILEEQ